MHTKKTAATIGLLGILGILGGCATATLGDKTVEAELKKFESKEGKVSLYVCREDTFNGGGVGVEAFVNGSTIGALKPNTFAHVALSAGEASIFLRRNGIGVHSGDSGTLKLNGKAGEVLIIWAGPGGFMGPLTVDFFKSTSEGESCVRKANYAVK